MALAEQLNLDELKPEQQTQRNRQVPDITWCPGCGSLKMGKIITRATHTATCTEHDFKSILKVDLAGVKITTVPLSIPINGNGDNGSVPPNGKKNGKIGQLGGMYTGEHCRTCNSAIVRDGSCGICMDCGSRNGGCA